MRKFTIFLLMVLTSISITKADYFSESVARFISSPNFEQIEKIEDPKIKFCEEAFLDGYRNGKLNLFWFLCSKNRRWT